MEKQASWFGFFRHEEPAVGAGLGGGNSGHIHCMEYAQKVFDAVSTEVVKRRYDPAVSLNPTLRTDQLVGLLEPAQAAQG